MTSEEEHAIRAWLTRIEETDPATIADVVHQCRYDMVGRNYLLALAAANKPQPKELDATGNDDRRTCNQCNNLMGRRCLAALRGEIAASRDHEPIRDMLMRCEGYAPKLTDPDQRPGRVRWPGLNRREVQMNDACDRSKGTKESDEVSDQRGAHS
ncbi:hypothetical protein Q8A64_01085 [Oxalobacteraceae bacterium R-40]|uniref:Uncharacterized protein n=1 Tax=Keguizhuia sedimenti TaxID=3064264 RepID=A0ABU1BLG9_9BURK|nr:hypothetical protein [Oxalobacteraceae bacterium R-40]